MIPETPSRKQRSKEEVVIEILTFLLEKDQLKTHVQYHIKTSSSMFKQIYEPFLFENSLVELKDGRWHITNNGKRYLKLEEQKIAILKNGGSTS